MTVPSDKYAFRDTGAAAHFDAALTDPKYVRPVLKKLLADARQDTDPVSRAHAKEALAELLVLGVFGVEVGNWIDASVLPETEPNTLPLPGSIPTEQGPI